MFLLLTSCNKKIDSTIYKFEDQNDVYILGDGKLWSNGVEVLLGDPFDAVDGFSIFGFGNDVYCAGRRRLSGGSKYLPSYWKNNTAYSLQTLANTSSGEATSIFATANDIYVAGNCNYVLNQLGQQVGRATLWKNNTPIQLSNSTDSYATGVFIFNNDVFVSGSESQGTHLVPILWKNGVKSILSNLEGEANNVFVSNGDVYVTGNLRINNRFEPFLWKNGIAQNLGISNARIRSLWVSGTDVFIGGTEVLQGVEKPIILKNNQIIRLITSNGSTVHSISVVDNNLYCVTSAGELWKNSVLISNKIISALGSDTRYKNAIYVKRR